MTIHASAATAAAAFINSELLCGVAKLMEAQSMRQLRRANARPTLARKIHFFRADVGIDGGGQLLPFDAVPALRVIDRLPFTNDRNGRYVLDDEGNALCIWPNMDGANTSLRFCQIRRTGLPQLEQAGNLTDLNIAADAGLLEPIHLVSSLAT